MLVGCGAKKSIGKSQASKAESAPAWHTCLIQGAVATITTNTDRFSASVTMQTVRDSMLVISVMPMLGMEMIRLEATPTELIAIDKLHGRYAKATFADLNRQLTPSLNWDILQQICSADLPTGNDKARKEAIREKQDELLRNTKRKSETRSARERFIREQMNSGKTFSDAWAAYERRR